MQNLFITLLLLATVLCVAWLCAAPFINRRSRRIYFANAGTPVTPGGQVTRRADAALASRYLLVKIGSDEDHIAVAGAADTPLGVCTDEAEAAEDPVAVNLLGSNMSTQRMTASKAIAAGALVYTAASGKIQDAPTGTTVIKVGRALMAATGDGHVIEVEPCFPLSVTFA